MAITRINVGTIANDGTGDDLRQAFVKVNNNFDDLDLRVQAQATADNLGDGVGIFYSKENGVIGLKSLVSGNNISITSDANTITITNNGVIGLNADSGGGSISGANRTVMFKGGQNVNTSATGNTITFNLDSNNLLQQDTAPVLGGHLDAAGFDITNAGTIVSTAFTGALTGTVDGINITNFYNDSRNVFNLDLGSILIIAVSGLDYMVSQTAFDYGSITSPSALLSDFGTVV